MLLKTVSIVYNSVQLLLLYWLCCFFVCSFLHSTFVCCFLTGGISVAQSLVKQSGLEDLFDSGDDDDDDVMKDIDGLRVSSSGDDLSTTIVRPNSPFCQRKSLPWKPKVRQAIAV